MAWKPPYATPDELAAFIGDASVGQESDQMALALETASRLVDRCCDRQFGKLDNAQARQYAARWDPYRNRWAIAIDDLQETDDLVVELGTGNGGAVLADVVPSPVNAVADGMAWTHLVCDGSAGAILGSIHQEHPVTVTAIWGWNEVPSAVRLATLLQASRLYARRHAPFGVAGNPEVGQLRLLERLDVDVAVSMRPYTRVWGAV